MPKDIRLTSRGDTSKDSCSISTFIAHPASGSRPLEQNATVCSYTVLFLLCFLSSIHLLPDFTVPTVEEPLLPDFTVYPAQTHSRPGSGFINLQFRIQAPSWPSDPLCTVHLLPDFTVYTVEEPLLPDFTVYPAQTHGRPGNGFSNLQFRIQAPSRPSHLLCNKSMNEVYVRGVSLAPFYFACTLMTS